MAHLEQNKIYQQEISKQGTCNQLKYVTKGNTDVGSNAGSTGCHLHKLGIQVHILGLYCEEKYNVYMTTIRA